jgi:histidyl-tRNA synthetase
MSKPSIPEGTRDFSPEQVAKRTYIFDTIRKVFIKYGFQPIETPTLEKLSTLEGKYGEEGDKLLYKIRSNKNLRYELEEKMSTEAFTELLKFYPYSFIPKGSENGLRYDLTVPFARYVVMHQNDITFPFKRYQIQPVWRGDRPQRGRYREFYQCDVDVVGSNSLVYEAELVQIYDEVFRDLGLNVTIKINNRKILYGMAEAAGIPDKFMDMTIAIDKLDKIGWEGVEKELQNRDINEEAISVINKLLKVNTLDELETFGAQSESLLRGVNELRTFHKYFDLKPQTNAIKFDITLARGLNYYTGCIFEVQANDVKMGSIGGGGRYDDLTGVFGLKGVSGVGVSFGADRIYDCLQELNLFPEETTQSLKVFFLASDNETHYFAFECLNEIRASGLSADIYNEPTHKEDKQWKYAVKRNPEYIIVVEPENMKTKKLRLKNMKTKKEELQTLKQIIKILTSKT